jgi:hypothetical protein
LIASKEAVDFSTFDNPDYSYDPSLRKYRNTKTGRFLSQQQIKGLIARRIASANTELQLIGDRLLSDKISLQDWQLQTAGILKTIHSQTFLLGVGGQKNIVFDDYLILARKLKEQYKYFRNFAIACKQGISPLQFRNRLGQYLKATKGTYYLGFRESAKRSGATHGYRILGDAEHCKECLQYASLGNIPIDEIVLPTEKCSCMIECKCNVVFGSESQIVDLAESVFEIDFSDGQYIVDKNGRWRDKNGRFVDMPDISTPGIKDAIASQVQGGKQLEGKNVVSDIEKLKLFSLTTPLAYKATIERLRTKYKKSPFALSVINSLQLDRGVSNKKNALGKVEELKKILESQDKRGSSQLNQSLRKIDLSKVQITPDDELQRVSVELEGKTGVQVTKDKAALGAIASYRQSVEDLNSVLSKIKDKPNLSDDDYEELFQEKEKIWGKMKGALDTVHEVKNEYLSEPILDKYIGSLQRISRESPGGFKIVVPKDTDELKDRAKKTEC